ncbi:hypothetical protein [Ancylomarina longa]|uniref:Uncharacterized protein n=1 Tax=Ancylomarina longa TaxID=2487017 RepID=A0A434AGG8_9BACT|nr:hypothetical protein [Ancylomarina longa]RUT73460.1 hypothetical protein DLK05_13345 [Ancylomarina longa]
MSKKNRIVNLRKLDTELVRKINEDYPFGFEDDIKRYLLGHDKTIYAFPLTTDDCNCLVKVDMDYDYSLHLEEEENMEET